MLEKACVYTTYTVTAYPGSGIRGTRNISDGGGRRLPSPPWYTTAKEKERATTNMRLWGRHETSSGPMLYRFFRSL